MDGCQADILSDTGLGLWLWNNARCIQIHVVYLFDTDLFCSPNLCVFPIIFKVSILQ